MKDNFTMERKLCADRSWVEYKIEDGKKMVYQTFDDWTKRKAEYERGEWIIF